MQVTETSAEGLKHEFKVVVPASELEQRMSARLQEVGRQVRVPGFRPGRVPLAVLKTRYGDAVRGEVVERAVNEGSAQAMQDKGLKPAVQPKVEVTSIEQGKDLEFRIEVEILPQIDPVDFSSLEVERLEVEVPDSDVDEALARLSQQFRSFEPVEKKRASKEGDVLVVDFEGKIDGVAFPGGSAEGYYLELGAAGLIPGFEEQLVGAKPGEDKEVRVTFPENYGNAEVAGKDAVFAVKVNELREPKSAAIDDEFAKQMGRESLDALKQDVRKDLAEAYRRSARGIMKRRLFDRLNDAHDFPLPPTMVDLEFQQIWRQVEQRRVAGELEEEDAAKDEETLRSEYRGIAERRVRLGLLLAEVGQRANIQVAPDELNRAVMEEVRRFPGQEQAVIEFYRKNPSMAEQLRAPIFEDKVVDYMVELAKVSTRKVGPEELKAEAEAAEGGDAPAEAKGKAKAKKAPSKAKSTKAKASKAKAEGAEN